MSTEVYLAFGAYTAGSFLWAVFVPLVHRPTLPWPAVQLGFCVAGFGVLWMLIGLAIGEIDFAIVCGAVGEGVFFNVLWLGSRPQAGGDDWRGRGRGDDEPPGPGPVDWDEFDRARRDWDRPPVAA